MEANRRTWLKQMGLSLAGLGLVRLESLASPLTVPVQYPDILPTNLRSNENPYGPSPMTKKAMAEHIAMSNRYNSQLKYELIDRLAKKNSVEPSNVLLSAGSTEMLEVVARYTASEKGSLVIADPSYHYWTAVAEKVGLRKIKVPLTVAKELDLPAMLSAIAADTKLVYICNPNNPTGTVCKREALVDFVKEAAKKALVLIDEAYIDFTPQQSLTSLAAEMRNVIVARTFSKIYGLAGARVGYAVAHPETIQKLADLQCWPNGSVSVASAAGAIAALNDEQFITETYSLNEKVRIYTQTQLQKLNLTVIPTQTNFVYFSLDKYSADFFKKLEEGQVLGTGIYEEQGKWTRITMGTMPEMQRFFAVIG